MISENNIRIFENILSSTLSDLKNDLIECAICYARIRVDWQLADVENRKVMEDSRTRAHNAFIDSCNILSRNMEKATENISWRSVLGNDRKVLGDFACFIHYYLGLKAR